MKKKLIFLGITFISLFSFLSCKEHVHEYGEWHEGVEATCEKEGSLGYYECECGLKFDKNGAEILDLIIPKKGHKYNEKTFEATCEEEGYTLYTCEYCGHQYKDNLISCLSHEYKEEITNPTCENQGYTTHTCNRCGHTYVDDYVEPLGHDYDEVEYSWNADFTKVTATRVCYNDEKHIESETVSSTYQVITPATCLSKGVGRYTSKKFRNTVFDVQTYDVLMSGTKIIHQ